MRFPALDAQNDPVGSRLWGFLYLILERRTSSWSSCRPIFISIYNIFISICSVFQGSNFETRLLKKMHPSHAKTMFLHVDEVWKWVDLGFQNRLKIVSFSTSILEAIFVQFLLQNEGFGSPRRRPNFSKNRSQDDSLEMLKNVSPKLSCDTTNV